VRHLHLIRTAPKNLDDYFRQKAERTVDRDRTVSLHGKAYEAPVNLVGRKVILLYNPDDLSRIEVFWDNTSHGFLVPLNPHINCRVRRKSKFTDIVPPEQCPPNTTPPYHGGKLFGKPEDTQNEL
jgi:hypothetical protein